MGLLDEKLKKLSDENREEYIWRVGHYADSGEYTWDELSETINKELGLDEEQWLSSSAYRKPWQQSNKFYQNVFSKRTNDDYISELENARRELERMKVQFRDERNAWNTQNRIEARIEQKFDLLEEELRELGKEKYPLGDNCIELDDKKSKDMVVMLTDLHIGVSNDNTFGNYDVEVAKKRISYYLTKVISIGKANSVKKVYVCLLGDCISGSIHKSVQISNRENVIDQIKIASKLVSDFCYELTKHFYQVYFASVSGNHSRLDRKEDSLHNERLDDLVSFYVENILNHVDNFEYIPNEIDCSIGKISVRNHEMILVHGDYDSYTPSGLQSLCMMTRSFPYAVLSGHMHTNSFQDVSDIKMIRGGSLCGSGDQYCIEKRISGRPSQMCFIVDDNGVYGLYPIVLD